MGAEFDPLRSWRAALSIFLDCDVYGIEGRLG